MQPTSNASQVSFGKNPRNGQQEVINAALLMRRGDLTCQLPTGYGKTFTALACYAELRQLGVVDRLLYIVPRNSQLNQFLNDAKDNFKEAGLKSLKKVHDVGYGQLAAIKAHCKNTCEVFVCTIQALATSGKTWDATLEMLQTGRWMIVVDEYHHYGNDASWGQKAVSLPCIFRLAMSATPYRVGRDSAFGEPQVRVLYRTALREHAVKRLKCHSYVYRLDVEMPDGSIRTMTTEDIVAEAGSADPNVIEQMTLDRKMRWLPKYVSPLVEIPINRMLDGRLKSGVPQQALITAMCCSHAQLVCEQVRAMFPDLRIDWVGTGDYGRLDKENITILNQFCPPKRESQRHPDDINLDVLVHVGMAGEGLDSLYVTEVIHLTPANITNSTNQKNGRAARIMPGLADEFQLAYINVDSSSEFAQYRGDSVMDLMDDLDTPKPREGEGDDDGEGGYDPDNQDIPINPILNGPRIVDMECIRVDEGDLERFKIAHAHALVKTGVEESASEVLENPAHPLHGIAEKLYREMKHREAVQFNAKAQNRYLRENVDGARRTVVNMCMKRLAPKGEERKDSTLPGRLMKTLNRHVGRIHGYCDKNASDDLLLHHQRFYHDLQNDIMAHGVPYWLTEGIESSTLW